MSFGVNKPDMKGGDRCMPALYITILDVFLY